MATKIHREEVQRLIKEGAQLLEVLPRKEYEKEHLPGAAHIGLKELDPVSCRALDTDRPVVVYCFDYQ